MAVSEQSLETDRSRHLPRPGRRALLFVLTAVLGSATVVGGLAVLHERSAGRILPGVSAGGVQLGGLTADEARAALSARYAGLSSGGIWVRSSIGSTKIAFADVGRHADIDGMVADAIARGRGGSWLEETIAGIRIQLEPQQVALRLVFDRDRSANVVAAWADRMEMDPVAAGVVTGATGFSILDSVDGRAIDTAAAKASLDAVLADPATPDGAIVSAPVVSWAPSLTHEEAVAAKEAADRVVAALPITSGDRTWILKAAQIRRWISFGLTGDHYGPIVDRAAIPAALTKIAHALSRPVRDAAFLRDKHGRIVGSMADRAGHELDVAASSAAIAGALEARAQLASPAAVELAMATIAPKRTTEEAAKTAPLMVKVGSWTTHYQVAAHNGFGANITVPTRVLDGTVVAPGAVFDFWAGLGEVSLRTGYKLGGAIVGGHSVEGKALAGGICAASTTLFNAALRGGFEILARQPHWYYITRYPLGLDATVSGSQTMRFRNDTAYPILIRGFASPGYVHYEIWSVPNGRRVSLSRPQVTNVVAGADSTVLASDLRTGTSERTEWPVDGKDVVVTRTVRDAAGHLIHVDTFISHYHRMIGINRIGIG